MASRPSHRSYNDLLSENAFLRKRLSEAEESYRQLAIKSGENRIWRSDEEFERARIAYRTPSPEEERFPREASRKRGEDVLGEFVAQVVGEKRRKVGGPTDPERKRWDGMPLMVKIGGVRWEEGIGGVEVALREAGIVFCEGTRWLVGEEELEKRKVGGRLSSTVVARVRGMEMMGQLCRSGLWVGGYWCSVKRFVAVQPRRKTAGWEKAVKKFGDRAEVIEEKSKKGRFMSGKVMMERMDMVVEAVRGIVNAKMEVTSHEMGIIRRKLEEMGTKERKEKWVKEKAVAEEMKVAKEEEARFEKEANAFFYEPKDWGGSKGGGGVDFSKPGGDSGFRF